MGYSNPALDDACSNALSGDRYSEEAVVLQQEIQQILAEDLPSIPLFYFPRLALSRTDLCGMLLDVTARSEFSNLEEFYISDSCE